MATDLGDPDGPPLLAGDAEGECDAEGLQGVVDGAGALAPPRDDIDEGGQLGLVTGLEAGDEVVPRASSGKLAPGSTLTRGALGSSPTAALPLVPATSMRTS